MRGPKGSKRGSSGRRSARATSSFRQGRRQHHTGIEADFDASDRYTFTVVRADDDLAVKLVREVRTLTFNEKAVASARSFIYISLGDALSSRLKSLPNAIIDHVRLANGIQITTGEECDTSVSITPLAPNDSAEQILNIQEQSALVQVRSCPFSSGVPANGLTFAPTNDSNGAIDTTFFIEG